MIGVACTWCISEVSYLHLSNNGMQKTLRSLVLENLACLYRGRTWNTLAGQGKFDEADPLLLRATEIAENAHCPDYPHLSNILDIRTTILLAQVGSRFRENVVFHASIRDMFQGIWRIFALTSQKPEFSQRLLSRC